MKQFYLFNLIMSGILGCSLPILANDDVSKMKDEQTPRINISKTPEKIQFDVENQNKRVFLNGVNINSVRSQTLDNVTIRIEDNGDIQIIAPQYEVLVEKNYTPLIPTEAPSFSKEKASIPAGALRMEDKNNPLPKSLSSSTTP
jgi:hypothetical protein